MIDVDHVTVRFNLATERVDSIKEYVIKLLKKELLFQEFLALRDVSFKVKKGETFYYEAKYKHYLKSDKGAKVLWISGPPSF